MTESETVTAERDQQNARPEAANGLRVAADPFPELTAAVNRVNALAARGHYTTAQTEVPF